MRFNDDYIMMPLQACTQWDALAHVYYDDQLYNGYPANSVTSFGASKNGIDKAASTGVVGRECSSTLHAFGESSIWSLGR